VASSSIVGNGQEKPLAGSRGSYLDPGRRFGAGDTVPHRILDEGLEKEARDERGSEIVGEIDHNRQPVREAHQLDPEIELLEGDLVGEANLLERIDGESGAEEFRQVEKHRLRLPAVLFHQAGDGIQGVEQEVRIDLVAKRPDLRLLRLRQQSGAAALLLAHGDAVAHGQIGGRPGEIEKVPIEGLVEDVGGGRGILIGVELLQEPGPDRRVKQGGDRRESGADQCLGSEGAAAPPPKHEIGGVEQDSAEGYEDGARPRDLELMVELYDGGPRREHQEMDREKDRDQPQRPAVKSALGLRRQNRVARPAGTAWRILVQTRSSIRAPAGGRSRAGGRQARADRPTTSRNRRGARPWPIRRLRAGRPRRYSRRAQQEARGKGADRPQSDDRRGRAAGGAAAGAHVAGQ
jgi:hypothetical protein